MSKTHACSCYADRAVQATVPVEEHVLLARDTYRLRLTCPEIARKILPGQFVMIRLPGRNDPLLGRPLAIYDVVFDADGMPTGLDLVYLKVGKMTGKLVGWKPGMMLEIWGPMGNGFSPVTCKHLVMVAGGIGQTPFLALAEEYLGRKRYGDPPRQVPRAERVTLCYGARTKDALACVEDFRRVGVDVRLATDDGSAGHHGLVTELIGPAVEQGAADCRMVACGPEAMLKATVAEARALDVPCQVSLETAMACGIGICFSCVTKVRDASGGWDYRRTCIEGPVFDAEDIVFD